MKNKFTGKVTTTSRGIGYVPLPEDHPAHSPDARDIEIEANNLNQALDGDEVEVMLLPQVEGERRRGEVIKIIRRAKEEFVGTIEENKAGTFFLPDNYRIYTDFFIPSRFISGAKDNDKVVVKLKEWDNPKKNPIGEVIEILGKKGDHETEMQAIIRERGIIYDFPQEVTEEAKEIAKLAPKLLLEEKDSRRDLTDITTFTIDPESAKDFDDALSYRELEDGKVEIGIHIADPTAYVKPDTAIDEEARHRAFTTYLVDRTIPMLPEVLANNLCSLNPHEEKLAFSALFTITREGEVTDRWFGKSIIYSDERYTYKDAQNQIDKGDGKHAAELTVLNEIAKRRTKRRYQAGSVMFSDDEVVFDLDENGKVKGIHKKERLDTHKLVEEFMLLANTEVALEVERLRQKTGKDLVFVYRVHDNPDLERLENVAEFLEALGYQFEPHKNITGSEINDLLKRIEESSLEDLINTTIIRSMSKAEYSVGNIGHFGLAFEHYSHFTSPIRRYPDMVTHRLFTQYINGDYSPEKPYAYYTNTLQHASERERVVVEAERESIAFKQVEYLADKVGDTFEVVVTGVSEYGLFVEEKTTKAQGLISIRTLGDDYFSLNKKQFALIGQNTGQKFTLGEEYTAKLTGADIDKRQLDFELVS